MNIQVHLTETKFCALLLRNSVYTYGIQQPVAWKPEFESKDCHPQMKISMISIILCDIYFVGMELLNFTPTS